MDKITKKRLATIADYQQVFGSEAGQRVLTDILYDCGIISSSYVQGDPHSTCFNEGRRSMGLKILEKIKIDMMKLKQQIDKGDFDEYYDFGTDDDPTR